MPIGLDITGFYYKIDVESAGVRSVFDVLKKAQGVRAPNGGVLRYELDKDNKFVEYLEVVYDGSSQPKTRQNKSPFGPFRQYGTYSYRDNVLSTKNRVLGEGDVSGLLAWQYYIYGANKVDKNRALDPEFRIVTPVTDTDPGYNIEDGDTIVFRLIAIFGINQFIDKNFKTLMAANNGDPLSLKSAAAILSEQKQLGQA